MGPALCFSHLRKSVKLKIHKLIKGMKAEQKKTKNFWQAAMNKSLAEAAPLASE